MVDAAVQALSGATATGTTSIHPAGLFGVEARSFLLPACLSAAASLNRSALDSLMSLDPGGLNATRENNNDGDFTDPVRES